MSISNWIALAVLAFSLLGMGAKLVMFMREIQMELKRIRAERRIVSSVPFIDFRVRLIEKHLGLDLPPAPPQHLEEDSHGQ
jgi:hypothetical protein